MLFLLWYTSRRVLKLDVTYTIGETTSMNGRENEILLCLLDKKKKKKKKKKDKKSSFRAERLGRKRFEDEITRFLIHPVK